MPQKPTEINKNFGLRLKKSDVKTMVEQYRTTTPKAKLKFAHFNLKEILDLFVDNKILDKEKLAQAVLSDTEKHGLKLYMAHHSDDRYCPNKPHYKGYNTIVVCNTIEDNGTFVDMLDDNKNEDGNKSIISENGGKDGLDQATICPPDCGDDDDLDPKNGSL